MTTRPAARLAGAARTALALSWRAAPGATLVLAGLTALTGGLPALSAWLGKLLFDELTAGGSASPARVVWCALGVTAALVLSTITASAAGYVGALIQSRVTVAVDDRLIGAVGGLRGLAELEDPRFLDRLRLAEEAAREAPPAVTGLAQESIRTAVTVAGFGGALLAVWPPMALVLLAAVVPAVVSQRALGRMRAKSIEATADSQRRHHQYRYLATDLRAAKEARLFGLTRLFHGRMLASLRVAQRVAVTNARRSAALSAGLALLSAAVSATAMVFAALRAVEGQLTIGDVTLFTAAVAGIQSAVSGLVATAGRALTALHLFRHYESIVDAKDALAPGTRRAPALRDGIELRDVWFRYEDGPWVLRGVNLVIPHGHAVGLVGLNGSGKSTLVKLLCRFYEPERGSIRWDGTDIREFDVASLRARLGVTFQDYMVYDLSAAENIGVGDVRRLDDRPAIRDAARIARLDAYLTGLPRGYDTLLSRAFLDEDDAAGSSLSGGQWQRMALARAAMRDDADLLILDEPSSGLDAEAEHEVHEALRAHRAGRTSLLVSHRLSALRDADRIVVLREGRVAEEGGHDELVGAGGDYARLFTMQASGYVARDPA